MRTLSELRAGIIRFYNSADIYILPILKFITAFLILFAINTNYGYMESLNNMFIVIILSVVCAFLPIIGTVAISIILIVIHCFGISVEIGLFAACLYLLLFILIIRFVANDSLAIIIAPFAFRFYMPSVIPVSLGMLGKIASALAGVAAVISVYFLNELPYIASMQNGEYSSLEILNAVIDGIVNNTEMIMTCIIFAAVIIIVYLIRKLCTTYGWMISSIVGNTIYVLLYIIGSFFLDIEINLISVIIGAVISLFITLILAFFKFNARYSGSRYLQFEDDDYYYYVKVIPKEKSSLTDDFDDDDFEEIYFKSEDESEISRPVPNANVNINHARNSNPQIYNTKINPPHTPNAADISPERSTPSQMQNTRVINRPQSEVSGDTQILNRPPKQNR